MTVDEQPPPTPAPDVRDQAVERYVVAMRRPRLIYAGVITVVVIALVAVVAVLWSGSEVAHTTLHQAAVAAPPVTPGTPSDPLRRAWQGSDHSAIGTPYWIGTVVTFDAHTVRGRNGTTGAVTWSYNRSDRTVCEAIQDQGTTVAIYEHGGNCDEVTALDSGTGTRKWTRTLDKDGAPLNGHPTYAVGPYTIMLTTPSVIYAFDPGSGLDRWTFSQRGCTIHGAALGSIGALISQTCVSPRCSGLKFCGAGPQLVMRDPTAGHSDDDKDKANPDQIKWIRLGLDATPASADQLVSAVDTATDQLVVFDAGKGSSSTQLPLHAGATAPITALPTTQAELLWIDATLYAVNLQSQTVTWSTPTSQPPTLTPPATANLGDVPTLDTATILVAQASGIDLLAGTDGRVRHTYAAANPAGARAYPFGTGFVVASVPTTVYQ
ncbi:MAG TPA: PQQ-binding-like beta-propeller repeat protein [Jatrophihabitantaceae bacterium]|nr:PQQ-binding-like beta-propeller repeat protein [Jatrophihabitantaceae bacterium]